MDNELCYYSYTDGQVEGEVKVVLDHISSEQPYRVSTNIVLNSIVIMALRSQVKTVDVAYYDDDDDVDDEILR